MNNVIDSDYVLISSCARNSFYDKSVLTMSKTSGVGWHTDTRYVNKKTFTEYDIWDNINFGRLDIRRWSYRIRTQIAQKKL